MNFLLELKFFILSHPLTSKQPRKIVQIHMPHPVYQQSSKLYYDITVQWSTIRHTGAKINMESQAKVQSCQLDGVKGEFVP